MEDGNPDEFLAIVVVRASCPCVTQAVKGVMRSLLRGSCDSAS